MPYTTQGYMTGADMSDLADLYDWWTPADEDEPDPECEARGCDIPDGYSECRRCGAEATDRDPAWMPGEYDPTGLLRSQH